MRYYIIEARSQISLAEDITKYIVSGWSCQGGVTAVVLSDGIRYLQAMVRY